MNSSMKTILIVFLCILSVGLFFFGLYELSIHLFPKVHVVYQSDLTIPVGQEAKLSSYILEMNGQLTEDVVLDTKYIGDHHLSFTYENEDHVKVKYAFDYQVIDVTSPIVWMNESYAVPVGTDENFYQQILCADDTDRNPDCHLVGEYDLQVPGSYPLLFEAVDASGNKLEHEFTLQVYEPKRGGTTKPYEPTKTLFSDIYQTYHNGMVDVGLDLSSWQGDVDFQKLKESGVQFVILRVGTSTGTYEENVVDRRFEEYYQKAKEAGLAVGLYFYSYGNSEERAIADANWEIEQIQGKEIDLPIAFDWEDFSHFNEYQMSLRDLSYMASAFLKTLSDHGYTGMLYASKSYLERLWYQLGYPVWLAHYPADPTILTSYAGSYEYWQLCSDGVIDGISGPVDIDLHFRR